MPTLFETARDQLLACAWAEVSAQEPDPLRRRGRLRGIARARRLASLAALAAEVQARRAAARALAAAGTPGRAYWEHHWATRELVRLHARLAAALRDPGGQGVNDG
jgi:hypothetical protein